MVVFAWIIAVVEASTTSSHPPDTNSCVLGPTVKAPVVIAHGVNSSTHWDYILRISTL